MFNITTIIKNLIPVEDPKQTEILTKCTATKEIEGFINAKQASEICGFVRGNEDIESQDWTEIPLFREVHNQIIREALKGNQTYEISEVTHEGLKNQMLKTLLIDHLKKYNFTVTEQNSGTRGCVLSIEWPPHQ